MAKPRILILDTYYPDVIRSMPVNPAGTYESELQAILNQSFGTADFYSRNLRALGWEVEDVIYNHRQLNSLPHAAPKYADVIFIQDLSLTIPRSSNQVTAGQLSCPWPGDHNVRKCDVIFTSFPHYVRRIEALGVKAVYNPLAFDPIVLERLKPISTERIYDCTFVGGVGSPSHWRRGMETLNAVAEAIPTFKWWGYGAEHLPVSSALFQKYQGPAWGLDMYRIFCQSKIVLNRHGEVAEGYSNNMRMFEATGCGAALLTEQSKNLSQLFPDTYCMPYRDPGEAIRIIEACLSNDRMYIDLIANAGQAWTLRHHTYAQRMKTVSDTLMEMLAAVPQ